MCFVMQAIRWGRGNGSDRGTYCGRGIKGQKARKGAQQLNAHVRKSLVQQQMHDVLCIHAACAGAPRLHWQLCLPRPGPRNSQLLYMLQLVTCFHCY